MFGKYGATIPDFNQTAQTAIMEVYRRKGPGYVSELMEKVDKPIKLFDKQIMNSQGSATDGTGVFRNCNNQGANGALDLAIHQNTQDYLPARPPSLIFPLGAYVLD